MCSLSEYLDMALNGVDLGNNKVVKVITKASSEATGAVGDMVEFALTYNDEKKNGASTGN